MAPKTPLLSKVLPLDEISPISSQKQDESEEKSAKDDDEKSARIQHATPDKKKKHTADKGSSSDYDTNRAPDLEIKLRKPTVKRPSEGGEDGEKDESRQNIKQRRVSPRMNKGKASDSASAATLPTGGRVFTEEDEIAILEGMIEFQLQKDHVDSSADMNELHECLKGKLGADFKRTQISEKIRRFRQKYMKMTGKYGTKTEEIVFSKPLELKIFELSKKIWGADEIKNKNEVKEAAAMKEEQGVFELLIEQFDVNSSEFSSIPESVRSFMKEKVSLIEEAKAKELMRKWKKLREEEAELFLKKATLMIDQARLVLAAMKMG